MKRNYHVLDKNGYIEMEITSKDDGSFTVHYPNYEQQNEILHSTSCFMRVNREQLDAILYAYDKVEYFKFCDYLKSKVGD